MRIDLSLSNTALYAGCEIETVAGRGNLKTPIADAVNCVGKNIKGIIDAFDILVQSHHDVKNPEAAIAARAEVTLTGPMAVWAYLVVFHRER
jgi:hypothetical protein